MGGNGTANFGWDSDDFPGVNPYTVPLGSYATTNPWGLFDVSSATSEWTEEVCTGTGGVRVRVHDGSFRAGTSGFAVLDAIYFVGGEYPSYSLPRFGLRIATIPSPASVCILFIGLVICPCKRRRIHKESSVGWMCGAAAHRPAPQILIDQL